MAANLKKAEKKALKMSIEEACNKASELFMSGTLCGKAILLGLQEVGWLPDNRWDFDGFDEKNPVPDGSFICKTMITGALAAYLKVIVKKGVDEEGPRLKRKDSIDRINNLFNTFLSKVSNGKGVKPSDFDPFKYDEYLKDIKVNKKAKKQYLKRVNKLFGVLKKKNKDWRCEKILGFNAWGYMASPEKYLANQSDKKLKKYISSGKWMNNCDNNIKLVIKTLIEN